MARKPELLKIVRREDLARSGLAAPATIKKLCLGDVLTELQTEMQTGIERAIAYEIPYFDVNGQKLDYSRWKLIAVNGEIGIKYYQDEKTIPHLYVPPLVDWPSISRDVNVPIGITEGEKKAACACLHKIPFIGVGGVWSWKSRKWGLDKLGDFSWFDWQKREVEICYDGDLYSNENVARALQELCNMLISLGARVFIRYLPTIDGISKLDDFLVEYGTDAYARLQLEEADESRHLWTLNDDLVYVKEMKGWYSAADKISYGKLEDLRKNYGHIVLPAEGKAQPKLAVDKWTRWQHRRVVHHLTYDPAKPLFHDDAYNLWRGWGMTPKRGNISIVKKIISGFGGTAFQNAFWQWLAYPIQHPGAKLNWAVVLWSRVQGTGKSYIGDVMQDIYGVGNWVVIGTADLYSGDNTWLRNVQFVVAEEITKSSDRRAADKLKHHITGGTVRVNEKYVPRYMLPNRANILLLSNHPDAIHIDDTDRRYCVAEVHNEPTNDKLWTEAGRWREAGGAAHLMYHLLNNVDCSHFNPKGRAPMTEDKAAMIYEGKSTLERWVADLISDPDSAFKDKAKLFNGKDVFTVEDLMCFMPEELDRIKPTPAAVSRALANAGAVRSGVLKVGGKSKKLVAVRNREYWRKHQRERKLWADNYPRQVKAGAFGRRTKK